MAFALRNYFHAMFLLFLWITISSFVTFYSIKWYFSKCLHSKYKDEVLYRVVMEEAAKKPHKVSFMFRFMFVPATFKNCLLALSGVNFPTYLLWYALWTLVFGSLYIGIGINLEYMEEYVNPKPFGEMSWLEKIKLVWGYCVMVFTLGVFITIYVFTHLSLRKFRKREKLRKWAEEKKGKIEEN